VEETPIWGGTIASTLAGEFSYTYGVGFALLFLGVLVRARMDGRSPWLPGAALALVSYAHGYAVLWAGLTAAGLLLADPGARRATTASPSAGLERSPTLRLVSWLAGVALVAVALAAPSLLPLLADWGWTTPYDDAWIDLTTRGVFPMLLQPFFAAAALGLVWSLARRFRSEPQDPRLLLLAFGALTGAALACAGPGLGVIDVRFVPLAQLALALTGALTLAALLARLTLADVAALGLVLVAATAADSRSRVLRSWIDWNYSGLEAKELWPAWRELTETLRKAHDDGRVAVEYGPVHERAGSIRMYETLPFFSGRDTLEGVYNQAATTTHPVYYLASELFARSPNPFRSRSYSSFDPESAVPRLRLFNVSEIVAVSSELEEALAARPDVEREAKIPPYTLFRLREPGPGYVEPLAFAPLRAPPHEWRDASYRWMTRKPANRALLVFTTDKRFEAAGDTWSPPTERPLPDEVDVRAHLEPESVSITTSRPGHPLLVKIAYHPRWRAEGADGPYLVSPGLMMIVPRQAEVRLTYAARTWADRLGRTVGLATLALGLALLGRRRMGKSSARARPEPPQPEGPGSHPPRLAARALRALPLLALAALAALRLAPERPHDVELPWLDEHAARAYAEDRWEDAAEYARHALERTPSDDKRRGELACLRGEALLRAQHPRLAAEAFGQVVDAGSGPYRPQALFSGALAREAAGDASGAAVWRARLRAEYPETPWAERLGQAP
ncbi:MAG TPA: 6-pyruvoyl-tetrahydropterin synthase-related protein, partial [Vicinamibacteria bacterium]